MNRPLARRAGPFVAATAGLLLTAAGVNPETGDLRMTKQGPWRADFEQPIRREPLLLYVLTNESPGAVLRLEPIEATTTR